MNTPGTISELGDMQDAHAHYDLASDTTVFRRGQRTLITISALPRINLAAIMQDVLAAYDPHHSASGIREGRLAGWKAASVAIDQDDGSLWATVVETHDLNLLIFARDIADAAAHRPAIEDLLGTVQFAPATFPEELVGSFKIEPAVTTSPEVITNRSLSAGTTIETHPDGTFTFDRESFAVGNELIFDSKAGQDGRWEVRGNRLLSFIPPSRFTNFLLDLEGNRLLLRGAKDERIHLVREEPDHLR